MDTYLFSIHKRWNILIFIELIKKIEVRKTAPKPPFKAIVYEPKNGGGCGKVIGEFICNDVSEYTHKRTKDGASKFTISEKDFKDMAIDGFDLFDYADGKDIYGIHITDTILYDKPRELGEFRKPCGNCIGKCAGEHYDRCPWQTITRPPQSWQYIQEKEECKEE